MTAPEGDVTSEDDDERVGTTESGEEGRPDPRSVVVAAIRTLAANQLRRGAPPLGLLLLYGAAGAVVYGVATADYLLLAAGAVLSAGALVAMAVRALLRARGRRERSWPGLVHVVALLPVAYGVYLVFYRGLRPLASLPETWLWPAAEALAFVVLGIWILRVTWKLAEIVRLAGEMAGLGE